SGRRLELAVSSVVLKTLQLRRSIVSTWQKVEWGGAEGGKQVVNFRSPETAVSDSTDGAFPVGSESDTDLIIQLPSVKSTHKNNTSSSKGTTLRGASPVSKDEELREEMNWEEKLTRAIYAANNGSRTVFVIRGNVRLTKPLPWIQENARFSIRGSCGPDRKCVIDGASKYPIFVSYASGCSLSVVDLELRNAKGGAAYMKSCSVEVRSCIFRKNEGDYGAAIFMGLGTQTFDISDSMFIDNKALLGDGGALFLSTRGKGRITNCTFDGNRAKNRGGAVKYHSSNEAFVCSATTFRSNVAGTGGGAMWISPTASDVADVFFMGCDFSNNKALTGNGGAIGLETQLTGHFCGTTYTSNQAREGDDVELVQDGGLPIHLYFCPVRPEGLHVTPDPKAVAVADTCAYCVAPS
ncbi:hypothetical protein CBR_g75163, partial [Chara braunii]